MASLRFTLCAVFFVVLMAVVEVKSEPIICKVNYPKAGKCPAYLSQENYPADTLSYRPRCECARDSDCPRGLLCCVGHGGSSTSCYHPEA
ncbi:uncharacterized protein LOC125027362 isoform X2 [Penaeus chinensis]|uniref:uncharacterized protein LOC125027362 isoform X2 n=1 Tax=Penaeus chinensis TaxID=139456 RepID=UPI001FB7EDF2|nr:uncharacterized protein LOC125027362 isoform X2 [Penaeus chinensis]